MFTSANMGRREGGQKEKEGCRPGHGLTSVSVTCSRESQLVTKHFAPGTPAHQPPVRASPSIRPFLLQVLYLVFKPSVLLLCLLHWATPGVFAGLSFPCLCNGGAGHACLRELWRKQPNVRHTLGAQRAKCHPSVWDRLSSLWAEQLFQDDDTPFEGFPGLNQEASYPTPHEGGRGQEQGGRQSQDGFPVGVAPWHLARNSFLVQRPKARKKEG